MRAIIFALITYLGWGSGDVLTAVGARRIGAYSMAFWGILFGVVFSALYIPFAPSSILSISFSTLITNIGLGLILAIAWATFNRSLETSNPTISGTIAAAFSPWVVLFSIIFLKETVTLLQLTMIGLTVVGLVLASIDLKVLKSSLKINYGTFLALVTMFLWGVYYTFIKFPIADLGWYWANMISLVVVVVVYLLVLIFRRPKLNSPLSNHAIYAVLGSVIFSTISIFSFHLALGLGKSSIIAPIATSSPTLYVLLSYFIFREKMSRQQVLGIFITLVGIVALAFSISV